MSVKPEFISQLPSSYGPMGGDFTYWSLFRSIKWA